jgi:outer membrane biosynthesis protein TonB
MNTELEDIQQRTHHNAPAASVPKPSTTPAHSGWDDEEEEKTAFQKYRLPVIAGIIIATGIGFVAKSLSGRPAGPAPKQEVMMVTTIAQPTPPPPAPTPPPPPMEEKKQEMIVEEKQEEAAHDPTPQVETALKGAGNTGMVLKSGNGSGIFSNRKTVNEEAMRRSAYAGQVKSRIQQALESNPRTRKAGMTIEIRVWPDETGRITRAKLANSTGDKELDDIIQNQILTGLQISQPPPEGMPTPIIMRITARRPS